MFQALEAFRGQLKGLSVTINFVTGNKQFVMVTPVVADDVKTKSPNLAQPFAFTATASELDADFAASITALADVRKTLAEQVAAQAAALKAKLAATATKPAQKTPSKVSITDGADDDGDGDQAVAQATVAEPRAADAAANSSVSGQADLTADSLFK